MVFSFVRLFFIARISIGVCMYVLWSMHMGPPRDVALRIFGHSATLYIKHNDGFYCSASTPRARHRTTTTTTTTTSHDDDVDTI
jgi:hypothetical protein